MAASAAYLQAIHAEATQRADRFDQSKIVCCDPAAPIVATQGQLEYEREHLKAKLQVRDPAWQPWQDRQLTPCFTWGQDRWQNGRSYRTSVPQA